MAVNEKTPLAARGVKDGVQSVELIPHHSNISVFSKFRFADIPPKTPPISEAALFFGVE
ncbi:hypothetical protein [Geotalea uraniireducens]|uniref:hypothetical protein n=1 Tax=Geotalea uraniireducens TaxID=351604 RepID=UPI00249126D9|nr:hypothetical protein [Geotalea uraniireducens]